MRMHRGLQNRTEEINVDLSGDSMLCVDISDALSERDKVWAFLSLGI
jgi:hypothetical protein